MSAGHSVRAHPMWTETRLAGIVQSFASVVNQKFVTFQQGEKRSGARRASAGRAVAHSSSLNNADGRLSPCPVGAPQIRHCGVAAPRKSRAIPSPLRLALTGLPSGPGAFDIAAVIGKEESLKRIDQALEKLPASRDPQSAGSDHNCPDLQASRHPWIHSPLAADRPTQFRGRIIRSVYYNRKITWNLIFQIVSRTLFPIVGRKPFA